MFKNLFKDYGVFEQIMANRYHFKLISILWWIYNKYDMFITCGYRSGDNGVHGSDPCRGVDLRSWFLEDPQAVADDINAHWTYDPARTSKKCAKFHAVCSKCKKSNDGPIVTHCRHCGEELTGWHIHIQSHPNTVKVN